MSDVQANPEKKNRSFLVYFIILAVILGALLGHYFPHLGIKAKLFGDIFLSLLFVLVVPLIMVSMICGVTNLGDIRHLEKLGLNTFTYYLSTTLLAVVTGLILVDIFNPGKNSRATPTEFPEIEYSIVQTPLSGGSILTFANGAESFTSIVNPKRNRIVLMDQHIIGIIDEYGKITPEAIPVMRWLDASGTKSEPALKGKGVKVITEEKKINISEVIKSYVPRNIFQAMIEENIFPLIVFCLVFGTVLTTIGEKGKPLIAVIEAMNTAIIKCVVLLMFLAPLGIFGLLAGSIGEAELSNPNGFIAEIARLARYATTVLLGLFLHGAISLILILKFIGRRRPLKFLKNMIPQVITAFSTGSSMATLPVSLTLVTEKNKVSEKVADFVLPLGATINMDGTALYQVVATIFIAQTYNISLGITEQIIVLLTATIGSIGAAGIPQAGLVTLVMVLKSVGLPVEGIGLILSIDWFIDRCRTTINTWGDVVGAAVIDYYEGNRPCDEDY